MTMTGPIELTEQPAQPIALVRGHVETTEYDEFLEDAFREVTALLRAQLLSPAGPPWARYQASRGGLDVEAGYPVDRDVRAAGRVAVATLPAGLWATAVHEGDHDTVGFTYEAIREWLAGNDYEPAGDPWESYVEVPPEQEPRTVVTMPCRKA
jgi:effector-binding domain-containing protein